MATITTFNFTTNNVPGAYYGALPELPVVQVATPGSFEFIYNATEEYLNTTGTWDMVWTVYFNSPDHLSRYPSDTGYQYKESGFVGDLFRGRAPPVDSSLTLAPVALNSTTSIWVPGDSLVYQMVELGEDRRTPTGRRVFSQNMTLIANETNPATTTSSRDELISAFSSRFEFGSRSVTLTSTRLPPDTTYTQWTAQAAVTSSGTGSGASSAATPTATQGNAGERVKAGGLLWRAGLALTLVSLVFGSL